MSLMMTKETYDKHITHCFCQDCLEMRAKKRKEKAEGSHSTSKGRTVGLAGLKPSASKSIRKKVLERWDKEYPKGIGLDVQDLTIQETAKAIFDDMGGILLLAENHGIDTSKLRKRWVKG